MVSSEISTQSAPVARPGLSRVPTVETRVLARLGLAVLALATTSPFAPWASEFPFHIDPSLAVLFVAGLLSGFLAGLLGVGGALITLPVLYATLPRLGVPHDQVPAVAVATALMAMVPTALLSAWRQHLKGAIDVPALARMTGPMTMGAVGGALLASQLHGPLLAWMFALQSLYYGSRLVMTRPNGSTGRVGRIAEAAGKVPPWIAGPVMAGFCACLGMGGGSVVTPYLERRFALSFRHSVATASALNPCIAIGGTLAFILFDQGHSGMAASAHLPAGFLLAGGAVAAVSAGVAAAHRLPGRTFQQAVGAINLIAAATLILQVARVA